MESDEDEEGLTDRERRRKKRRQKEVVADDSFDPHTMQEIQSLVKVGDCSPHLLCNPRTLDYQADEIGTTGQQQCM